MLRVNIRSAETISWYKNGILLKEGADGGRVTGVHTNTLVFTKLLPRDKGAKVTAHGKNKWGKVVTRIQNTWLFLLVLPLWRNPVWSVLFSLMDLRLPGPAVER